ncbi:MAG: hypothetical protein ACK4V1_09745, partial [Burkholderiaceae bacterium]
GRLRRSPRRPPPPPRDGERGSRAAHALRASAQFLGALRLASMSGDLDAALRRAQDAACGDAHWESARDLLEAIDREHQAVLMLLFESSR